MTELAVPEAAPVANRNGNTPAVQQQLPSGATSLIEWAQQADIAYQMATKLAATSFVPQSLRGKPGDVAAAILAGQELGLKPMATLKSIDVIQGTPALRAHAMRGILQNQGHEIELRESDEQHCIMQGRRAGAENWQTVVWTIKRAEQLGLTGKGEWKKQPQTMLVARATGEICRLIASDALHGMPYAAEELSGTTELTVERIQAPPLSVAALTAPVATPRPVETPSYDVTREDDELAPHEWDIHTLAATLGMSEKDLEERCYGVTGGSLAEATEAQHQALFKELANEMVARDNARQ